MCLLFRSNFPNPGNGHSCPKGFGSCRRRVGKTQLPIHTPPRSARAIIGAGSVKRSPTRRDSKFSGRRHCLYKNKPTARPKAPIKGARTTQSGSVGRTTRGATLGSGWLCRDSRFLTEVALKYHTDIHEHGSWRRGLARAGQARPGGVYGTKARPLPLEVASHN